MTVRKPIADELAYSGVPRPAVDLLEV